MIEVALNTLTINPFIHLYENNGRTLAFDASIPRFYIVSDECANYLAKVKAGVFETELQRHSGFEAMIETLLEYGILLDNRGLSIPSPVMGERKEPWIDTIFLIVSDACNYQCEYCHIMHNKAESINRNMSSEQLHDYLSYFDKVSDHSLKRNIVFFGGEPLLNFEIISQAVKFWEGRSNIEFALFTNCSLVDDEIAKKLAEWGVRVIASIDGFESEHGAARIHADGKSSYRRTLDGYKTLQKYGCIVGISCTVGKHNAANLPQICAEMIDQLKPVNIGFNILHDRIGETGQTIEEIRFVNEQMLEAYKVCMEKGIYFVQAVNRLRPIIDERPRAQDCGAYGRQIVVTPSGHIGPCEVFSSSGTSFSSFDPNIDVRENQVFNEWANRFPIRFPECEGCHAIALCGGGCAYDSVLHYGDIKHKDERCCEQAFIFFEFIKNYIFDSLYEVASEYDISVISRDGLKQLYGMIDVDSESHPLTTYHKRLNVRKGI